MIDQTGSCQGIYENKKKISLVFLDVRMPKKDGKAVYEEIRRISDGTKFLFFSGYTAEIMEQPRNQCGRAEFPVEGRARRKY
jgi:response regulator RpfG family c-di-GMP phosphodiesterase